MGAHALEADPPGEAEEGKAPPISSPRTLTGWRLSRRALASRILAQALAVTKGAGPIARLLRVTLQTVYRWADPEQRHAMTLGDVLACPPDVARLILTMCLAALEASEQGGPSALPKAIASHLHRITADVGDLARHYDLAMADDVLTKDELLEQLRDVHRLQTAAQALGRVIHRGLDDIDPPSQKEPRWPRSPDAP